MSHTRPGAQVGMPLVYNDAIPVDKNGQLVCAVPAYGKRQAGDACARPNLETKPAPSTMKTSETKLSTTLPPSTLLAPNQLIRTPRPLDQTTGDRYFTLAECMAGDNISCSLASTPIMKSVDPPSTIASATSTSTSHRPAAPHDPCHPWHVLCTLYLETTTERAQIRKRYANEVMNW